MINFSKGFLRSLYFVLMVLLLASCSTLVKNLNSVAIDVPGSEVIPPSGSVTAETEETMRKKYREVELPGRGEVTASDKLNVALLVPLSGPIKSVGESIVNAAQLSLFINGKDNIRFRFYDTRGTTFGAVSAINAAIADGVHTVIGPLFKVETRAVQKIAKKNHILLFSLSSEQDLVDSESVFVTGSIIEQEIQTLISYLVEKDTRNYVGFMPLSNFGAEVNRVLRGIVTGKDAMLIKTEYYEQDDPKMLQKINDLVSFYEIPQTIYENFEKKKLEHKLMGLAGEPEFAVSEDDKIYPQAMFIAEGGRFAEQVASLIFVIRRNGNNIQLIGTSKLDGDWNAMKNPYLNETIFVGANPEKYGEYSKNYNEIYGQMPLKITSMVYDLVNIIDNVYEKREDGSYALNRLALLNPEGFDGIDGKFRFLPNGLVERKLHVLQFKDGEKVVLSTNQEFLNY